MRLFAAITLVLLVASLAPTTSTNPCSPAYAASCALVGDRCLTGCNDVVARENDEEFCFTESGTKICDDTVQNCCKANTGVILGITVGVAAAVLGVVAVLIYFFYYLPEKKELAAAKEQEQAEQGPEQQQPDDA